MNFNNDFFDKSYEFFKTGSVKEALGMLDMIPENDPEHVKALFYKSVMLKSIDEDQKSLELLKKSAELEFLRSDSTKDTDKCFEIAMELYNDEDYENAFRLFNICIEKNYSLTDSLLYKSMCLGKLGFIDDANNCIDETLKIDSDNPELFQLKSQYLGEMGSYDESLKIIDKAIESDPECFENYRIKAVTLFKMERYDEALKCLDKDPDNPDSLILRCKYYIDIEDWKNAEKYFEIAEEKYKNNTEVLFAIADYCLYRNDFENANKYIDKCLEIEPKSDLFTRFKLMIPTPGKFIDDTLDEIYNRNPDFLKHYLTDNRTQLSFDSDKFALENIRYGMDYPSQTMNYNIYNVLKALKHDSNITNAYSNLNDFNKNDLTDIMIETDLIHGVVPDEINLKKEISKKSVNELSQLLKNKGINASGKKKKLIKLALKNIDPVHLCSNFTLTGEGEEFINEYSWFEIYDNCLEPFDLNDLSRYINENEKDSEEAIYDYLNEHIKLAHEKEDFDYLDDCLISQSLFCCYRKDYDNCLKASLKELILKFNPVYEYEIYYALYRIIHPITVRNINESLQNINPDLESLFYELWDLKDSETDFTDKKTGFNYLKRILDGESIEELSDEYVEKHINI